MLNDSEVQPGQLIEDIDALRFVSEHELLSHGDVDFSFQTYDGQSYSQEHTVTLNTYASPDPYTNLLWGHRAVHVAEALEHGYSGEGVVVAVIDTGLDHTDQDINPNLWRNIDEIAGDGIDNDNNGYIDDITGYDMYNDDNFAQDDHGHGTWGAKLTAGERGNATEAYGLAPDAELMAIKTFSSTGRATTSKIIEGINYAVDNGAHVINASFGVQGHFSPSTLAAIENAAAHNVTFVAAAGNSSTDALFFYPAGYTSDNIISVAASDSSGDLAWFSNYSNYGAVDLAAPGASIRAYDLEGNPIIINGTSFAAPYVSGAVALMQSYWLENYNETMHYSAIKTILMSTVTKDSDFTYITYSGGILNIDAAMDMLTQSTYDDDNDGYINGTDVADYIISTMGADLEQNGTYLEYITGGDGEDSLVYRRNIETYRFDYDDLTEELTVFLAGGTGEDLAQQYDFIANDIENFIFNGVNFNRDQLLTWIDNNPENDLTEVLPEQQAPIALVDATVSEDAELNIALDSVVITPVEDEELIQLPYVA